MKKNLFLIGMAVAIMLLGVSCSKQVEETKMIPASAVNFSGDHKDLITVADDSVKVMLVKTEPESDLWTIRAIVSLKNTVEWENIESLYQPTKDNYEFYDFSSNCQAEFKDQNNAKIEYYLDIESSTIKDLVKSSQIKTDNIQLNLHGNSWHTDGMKYEEAKSIFDKISSIEISGIYLIERERPIVITAENIEFSKELEGIVEVVGDEFTVYNNSEGRNAIKITLNQESETFA